MPQGVCHRGPQDGTGTLVSPPAYATEPLSLKELWFLTSSLIVIENTSFPSKAQALEFRSSKTGPNCSIYIKVETYNF